MGKKVDLKELSSILEAETCNFYAKSKSFNNGFGGILTDGDKQSLVNRIESEQKQAAAAADLD